MAGRLIGVTPATTASVIPGAQMFRGVILTLPPMSIGIAVFNPTKQSSLVFKAPKAPQRQKFPRLTVVLAAVLQAPRAPKGTQLPSSAVRAVRAVWSLARACRPV